MAKFQISAKAPVADVVEVKSCVVSPLSDPKTSPFWTVISDGCSSDSSATVSVKTKDEEKGGGDEKEETEEVEKGRVIHVAGGRGARKTAKEIQPLRFSFILRPVYNNSVQFLHCSLRLCVSDFTRGEPTKAAVSTDQTDCQGRLPIPPLLSRSRTRHQVHNNTSNSPAVCRLLF